MKNDSIKSVSVIEISEDIQYFNTDPKHLVGLRRTRTVRMTTQEFHSSECTQSATKSKSWKEWLRALLLMGLRIVWDKCNLTFCKPALLLGENIEGTRVLRGSVGWQQRTPLVFRNWITWPSGWDTLCLN